MESEQMYNNYMTVNQYNLFQSKLQWYNELCISQQNNYNQLCQLQLNQRKYCNTCKVFKSYTEFNKCNRNKDGLYNKCKQCRSDYSQRPEVQQCKKEYNKKYYDEHNDYYREHNQKYKSEHRDEINEYRRNRYQNDLNYRIICNLSSRIKDVLR